MAFNHWDKLAKAQRDYPKPKFALAFVDKQLKKNASSPHLLTWKADISLRLSQDPAQICTTLERALALPGLTDPQLLSYWYKQYLEAKRRLFIVKKGHDIPNVGNDALKPWQAAAKTLQRQSDRLALWEALFTTAMQENCWEDVRFAVVNYAKEGFADKKQSHYTLILATQLAAEQKAKKDGHDDRMAQIQFATALRYMKQSFTASQDDAIAAKDIRDLRFMAEIFKRQERIDELFDIWENPPDRLKMLFRRHQDDLTSVKTRVARDSSSWVSLERHCIDTIENALSYLNLARESKPEPGEKIWELCAWNWEIWDALLNAVRRIRPGPEGVEIIRKQMASTFGTCLKSKDRPLQLTYMTLRQFTGELTLSDCQEYFITHGHFTSCFKDLRPFVVNYDRKEGKDFMRAITIHARQSMQVNHENPKQIEKWRQIELNALKFEYLFKISRTSVSNEPQTLILERLFERTMRLSELWPENPEVSYLAVYVLNTLHYIYVGGEPDENPLERSVNSRILLQMTMYARLLVEKDKDKQNRTMSLLTARLHLNLGLGVIGFKIYRHAKCKEMLLDTLAPYMLSRISQTHPFDIGGYQGFSADEELAAVIGTIERMERKTDTFIFTDMPSFRWDQTIDGRDLKQKLRSSHTKHLCLIERQRIARLKGESLDNLPNLDYRFYVEYSDNIDRGVFEHFDLWDGSLQALYLFMPNSIPDRSCAVNTFLQLDRSAKSLRPEPIGVHEMFIFDETNRGDNATGKHEPTRVEKRLRPFWQNINIILSEIRRAEDYGRPASRGKCWPAVLDDLRCMRKAVETLRMPGNTTLNPEDEPTMFHENMLMSCYGQLEVLRMLNKICELVRDKVMKAKSKGMLAIKAQLPKDYAADLQQETQVCYSAIRDVAQGYIDLLLKRGVKAITAQVRWGPTGKVLKDFLTDDDVNYYAREYVESAVEAWKGVLKVKLK